MYAICTFIIILTSLSWYMSSRPFLFCKEIRHPCSRVCTLGMGPRSCSVKDGTAILLESSHWEAAIEWQARGRRYDRSQDRELCQSLNPEGTVVRINLSGKNIDQTALPHECLGTILRINLKSQINRQRQDLSCPTMMRPSLRKMGQKYRLLTLDVRYQMPVSEGRLITQRGSHEQHSEYYCVSLLAFVRGGAVDHYSNHVRVVPRWWLKAGLGAMTRSRSD